ncbi:hypothetical protein Tco_0933587 [Tanacetum coccineum]
MKKNKDASDELDNVKTNDGVSRSTKSSRSKSTDNTKNDRILHTSSNTQKKNEVKDHSRIVKSCLSKPNCVVEPSGNVNVHHSKLNTNFKLRCIKCNSSMFDARHESCFLEFVSDMNASSKSKSVKKAKKKQEWKPTRKVFTKFGYNWRPTGRTFTLVRNTCHLTRITATNKVPFREPIPLKVIAQDFVVTKVDTRRPKEPKTSGSNSKPKIAKSMISTKRDPVHLGDLILQLLHLLLLLSISGEDEFHDDNLPPPPPPVPPIQQAPHTLSTIKLPILKKGEYDIWVMKMKHYLGYTDYPIWEVIQKGNGPVQVSTDVNGQIRVLPPKTFEEILARERERKARTTLLMSIPEDHLAKFQKMTDAKEMWEAIKSRFGGNDESKKMQKYILKQQFESFSVSPLKMPIRSFLGLYLLPGTKYP